VRSRCICFFAMQAVAGSTKINTAVSLYSVLSPSLRPCMKGEMGLFREWSSHAARKYDESGSGEVKSGHKCTKMPTDVPAIQGLI
jgi:hypothetical protein